MSCFTGVTTGDLCLRGGRETKSEATTGRSSEPSDPATLPTFRNVRRPGEAPRTTAIRGMLGAVLFPPSNLLKLSFESLASLCLPSARARVEIPSRMILSSHAARYQNYCRLVLIKYVVVNPALDS